MKPSNPSARQVPGGPAYQCEDICHRGERHWYRITGLTGWQRAARGLPAWGRHWQKPGNRVEINQMKGKQP